MADWTKCSTYIIRMPSPYLRQLNAATHAQMEAQYAAYLAWMRAKHVPQ